MTPTFLLFIVLITYVGALAHEFPSTEDACTSGATANADPCKRSYWENGRCYISINYACYGPPLEWCKRTFEENGLYCLNITFDEATQVCTGVSAPDAAVLPKCSMKVNVTLTMPYASVDTNGAGDLLHFTFVHAAALAAWWCVSK